MSQDIRAKHATDHRHLYQKRFRGVSNSIAGGRAWWKDGLFELLKMRAESPPSHKAARVTAACSLPVSAEIILPTPFLFRGAVCMPSTAHMERAPPLVSPSDYSRVRVLRAQKTGNPLSSPLTP
jgi:hypothetical protein